MIRNLKFAVLTALIVSLVLSSEVAQAEDLANGKAKFEALCASCHGATGAGDGPIALALPPEQKPADLAHGKRKFATDKAKFNELLDKGGAAVGLNPLMPPQAGLSDKDKADLYAFVESLKK